MSDPRPISEPGEQKARSSRSRVLFPVIALVALGAAVAVLWNLSGRLQELGRRLESTEQRAAVAEERVSEYSQALEQTRAKADAASQQASTAEENARQLAEAKADAELEAEHSRQQSEAAQEQAQQALAEKQQARQELDLLRQRREKELNRMREALNRIAPTRRTPSGMVMELASESFQFDFDKATLRPDNRELLSRIAGVLLASEGYRLFIDGYTDDIGTAEYNKDLSLRRAESVRNYLVKAGIPEEITTVQGFGKSNPLVDARTREARQKNRRVEIGIVDTIIDYKGEVKTAEKH